MPSNLNFRKEGSGVTCVLCSWFSPTAFQGGAVAWGKQSRGERCFLLPGKWDGFKVSCPELLSLPDLPPCPSPISPQMHVTSLLTRTRRTGISGCRRTIARSPTPRPGSTPTRTSPAGSCTGGRCCLHRAFTCTGTISR